MCQASRWERKLSREGEGRRGVKSEWESVRHCHTKKKPSVVCNRREQDRTVSNFNTPVVLQQFFIFMMIFFRIVDSGV